jgi:hypothetical protein
VADGEVGLLVAPVEALVSSRTEGFNIVGKVLSVEGLRVLPTFGDTLSSARFLTCEAIWIS